jgi:hypothetical protein
VPDVQQGPPLGVLAGGEERLAPTTPRETLAVETSVVTPPPPPQRSAPTWSTIYALYFAPNTEGGCGRSKACHAAEMSDAGSSYAWLEQRGYIAGPRSPLVSTSNSCLRWFGGNMPPHGKPNPHAAEDLSAWAASGAPNN